MMTAREARAAIKQAKHLNLWIYINLGPYRHHHVRTNKTEAIALLKGIPQHDPVYAQWSGEQLIIGKPETP